MIKKENVNPIYLKSYTSVKLDTTLGVDSYAYLQKMIRLTDLG